MSKKTINAQYAASTWQYDITVKNTGTRVTWKIDQTQFLDQMDYPIGKLPDQTEVHIRTCSDQT